MIVHPFAPEVDWRIAISRRFSHPAAVDFFESVVRPALQGNGILLEVSGALDDPKSNEYWANRMRLVLECSDIHILLDVANSGNLDWEFEQARRLASHGHPSALPGNLRWLGTQMRLPMRPYTLVISRSRSFSRFSRWRRQAKVGCPLGEAPEASQARIRSALIRIKESLAKELRRADRWMERVAKAIDMPHDSIPYVLGLMTELASRIRQGDDVTAIVAYFDEKAMSSTFRVREPGPGSNDVDAWILAVRQGEIVLPERFLDRVAVLRTKFDTLFTDQFGPGFTEGRAVRTFIRIAAFPGAWTLSRMAARSRRERAAAEKVLVDS